MNTESLLVSCYKNLYLLERKLSCSYVMAVFATDDTNFLKGL
jgi:hypothetical protein